MISGTIVCLFYHWFFWPPWNGRSCVLRRTKHVDFLLQPGLLQCVLWPSSLTAWLHGHFACRLQQLQIHMSGDSTLQGDWAAFTAPIPAPTQLQVGPGVVLARMRFALCRLSQQTDLSARLLPEHKQGIRLCLVSPVTGNQLCAAERQCLKLHPLHLPYYEAARLPLDKTTST